MKIVSCFSDLKELEPLARAGADEFYTAAEGLLPFSSGTLPPEHLAAAVKRAHRLGRRISIAVNTLLATATVRQLAAIERRVLALDALGADAFIFGNPYLLAKFSGRLRAQLHLSSLQPVFNSLSAAFFARFGVSRIILPNQLAPAEASRLLAFCRGKGIETEIFDYRFFGCAYVNGRCQLHRPGHYTLRESMSEGMLCRINARPGGLVRALRPDEPARARELPRLAARLERRFTCGGAPRLSNAAAFFDLYSAGVQYLKYGIRQDAPEVKARKVGELRRMIDLAAGLAAGRSRAAARRAFAAEMSGWNGGGF